MIDAKRPQRTSLRYESFVLGLVATNLFGCFALLLFADLLPKPAMYLVLIVLSLPIAWPLPLLIEATGLNPYSFSAIEAVPLLLLVVFPLVWLNAVLWGRGLAKLVVVLTKTPDL